MNSNSTLATGSPAPQNSELIPGPQSQLIELALSEDAVTADLTARATIGASTRGGARITAKAEGVLSGTMIASEVFSRVNPDIQCRWQTNDGAHLQAGQVIAKLTGPLHALLAAERTALNFLQHLSGIATATYAYVEAVKDLSCHIVDTRKTTPGMRDLEKQAVRHGGGENHRMDLQSGMLIKENHIKASGSITDAVHACYALQTQLQSEAWIEVECETMDEVREAIAVCPDIILLDNMSLNEVREARALVPTSILLEASGNITLANARDYAKTGVNRIAIGAVTHSAPALDLSMRVEAVDQAV